MSRPAAGARFSRAYSRVGTQWPAAMKPLLPLLFLGVGLPAVAQDSRPAVSFERVVMIGASVTHGGAPAAAILDAAIRQEHEEIERLGNPNIALDPVTLGRGQMERAVRHEASVVVGIDILFWYAYGRPYLHDHPDPKDPDGWRLLRVERGLRDLDQVPLPLVLGEVPDMRGASDALLPASLLPGPEALTRINQRVRAWARERPRVLLLPLCQWVADMRAGRLGLPPAVDARATPLAADLILSADRLHPSRAGYVLLGSWLVDALEQWLPAAARGRVAQPGARVRADLAQSLPARR